MDEPRETPPGDDLKARLDAIPDPLLGTVLAERYRLDRVVGFGGMGVVYGAYQLGLDREVAVKVLHPDLVSSQKEAARFRREALATARLRHPNIITVHDFGVTEQGRAFLVMQFLTGKTLREALKQHGPYTGIEAVQLLKPVCLAVDASHRAGIVHCDIKPANIVIPNADDPDDVVRVVDFGIARLREQSDTTHQTGSFIMGSPLYMAPELADGTRASTPSDIYSLAVVAYETLTGTRPYPGRSYFEILRAHVEGPPLPPSSIRPEIPTAVDRALLQCLDADPSARFQSAAQLADALESAMGAPTPQPSGPQAQSILVVDDDLDIARLIQMVLEGCGYQVTIAQDGVDALMRLGATTFDLIISDIEMPNLDGFTLLAMTSQKGIRAPVIFLTARTSEADEIRGLELGAGDYIHKPFTVPVLVARVKRMLEKSVGG